MLSNSKIVAGILAHVDAGKTTLSEALLLESGVISKAGRVDNKDAFLDTDYVEKERGITIYSKNARLPVNNNEIILIDTPGHVDFSPEMERTLSVLDIAILLISAPAGIQAHTRTLWSLLKLYKIPTIIFVNKMDMDTANFPSILKSIQSELSSSAVNFNENDSSILMENIASNNENLMDIFLKDGFISDEAISREFYNRELFPVFFGSALKQKQIDYFLNKSQNLIFSDSLLSKRNTSELSALVYKINYEDNKRLSFIKITGGSLKVKDYLGEEKINELRIYSGKKYKTVSEVNSGEIVCIPGLMNTQTGDSFGLKNNIKKPVLVPAISYAVHYPDNIDRTEMLNIIKELNDEDPSLNANYQEESKEIQISLMGDVQIEVLKRTVKDKYGIDITIDSGKILYKETIDDTAIGIGHFEPLRHYAEVHIKLEPLERGSGLAFETDISEDILDKNWQRLILTHLKEKEHKGVLTGAVVTDIKFTLVAGKAHIKHTEGGDFRQATYRAVRQALMQLRERSCCHLLEPYYDYTIKIPDNYVGRAMTDINSMSGSCQIAENDYDNNITILTGSAPVAAMNEYSKELTSYTKGLGEISFTVSGYELCHNEEDILANCKYNPESDLRNTPDSIFCSHGAGTVIPWHQVYEYRHVDYDGTNFKSLTDASSYAENAAANRMRAQYNSSDIAISTEEINQIIKSTSHANENGRKSSYKGISSALRERQRISPTKTEGITEYKGSIQKDKYMLIDGYNVIHAWESLKDFAPNDLNAASGKLNDIMCNYQAMTGINIIVVYDAYKVIGHKTEVIPYHNINIVYTRESQTADQYIERYANQNASKYNITVVTSDGLEQIIIRGEGCQLISSREFELHVKATTEEFNQKYGVLQ